MLSIASVMFFVVVFNAPHSTSANTSDESRAFSFEVCRDWYEDRYYDWENPIVPLNSRKHYNAMCLHFHKIILTELYGRSKDAPTLISGGSKEKCESFVDEFGSDEPGHRHSDLIDGCITRSIVDFALHRQCVSRGQSAHKKIPYVECRSKLQFEQENGWRPFTEVHRSAEMYVNERSVNGIYVMRWFNEVEKLNPHLMCPRGAAWSLFEQCSIKFASPPYPIEVDER